MYNKKGFYVRSKIEAKGNAVLLLVVDSGGPYWHNAIVDETITYALMHFGIPFRFLDINVERIDKEKLKNCAGVVLAQNLVGSALSCEEALSISEAVKEEGIGFVGFDNDIRYFKPQLLEMFGFGNIEPYPYGTEMIRISSNSHYITGMQKENEFYSFNRAVSCTLAGEWSRDVKVLAEGISNKEESDTGLQDQPCLFAAKWGKGRAVQFLINPRVFTRNCFGHARGIDDIFFRSLIWTARKPFAANAIPPFMTMSFDDCAGKHGFVYADILSRAGFIPILFLFLDFVPEKYLPKIRSHIDNNEVEYSSHGFDYYSFMTFEMGKGPYDEYMMKHAFYKDDRFWDRAGCRPGPVNRNHHGEWSIKAIEYLKERNRMFFSPAHQPDVLKSDQSLEEGYWPYGLATCCYDYLPDDPYFYLVSANIKKGRDQSKYSEDFFEGATPMLNENSRVDIDKIAENIYFQLHEGVKAGFFGEARTHEQKFANVSLREWEKIVRLVKWKLIDCEYIPKELGGIAAYLKQREGTYISKAGITDGNIEFCMDASSPFENLVSVFREDDGEVVRDFYKISEYKNIV
jgi:hypothetical protein